jgi:hypothetical protein
MKTRKNSLRSAFILATTFSICIWSMEPQDRADNFFDSKAGIAFLRELHDDQDFLVTLKFSDGEQIIALNLFKEISKTFKSMTEDIPPSKPIHLEQDASTKLPAAASSIDIKDPTRKIFRFMTFSYFLDKLGMKVHPTMFKEPLSVEFREKVLIAAEKLDASFAKKAVLQSDGLDFNKDLITLGEIVLHMTALFSSANKTIDEWMKNKTLLEQKQALLFVSLLSGDPLDPSHQALRASICRNNLQLLFPYPKGKALEFLKSSAPARELVNKLFLELYLDQLLYKNWGQKERLLTNIEKEFWAAMIGVAKDSVPIVKYELGTLSLINIPASAQEQQLINTLNEFFRTLKTLLNKFGIEIVSIVQEQKVYKIDLSFSTFSLSLDGTSKEQIMAMVALQKELSSNELKKQEISRKISLFRKHLFNIFEDLINSDDNSYREELLKNIRDSKFAMLFVDFKKDSDAFELLKRSRMAREVVLNLLNDVFWEHFLYGAVSGEKRIVEEIEKQFWTAIQSENVMAPLLVWKKDKFVSANLKNKILGEERLIHDLNTAIKIIVDSLSKQNITVKIIKDKVQDPLRIVLKKQPC